MERGPLIGGALLVVAAVGVVGFYLVMASGDTGDMPETTRQVHQVEQLEKKDQHEVVRQPETPAPEDPVAAVIQGEWDTKQHGQISGDDWDEIRAVQAQKSRAKMEGIVEAYIASLDVDKAAVRQTLEDLHVKQEAVNAEVQEGWISTRAARKQHDEARKEAEKKMFELLGQEKAEELRDKLAKQRMVFY